MASLKDVKMKISGVKKTKQITKAMNMVASAKLRGAQQRIEHFRLYARKFEEMMNSLTANVNQDFHPLLAQRDGPKTAIIMMTSDRGLAGSYNINVITAGLRLAAEKKRAGKEVTFYCIGKKGRDAVRKTEYAIAGSLVGEMGSFDFTLANSIGMQIMDAFTGGTYDEVFIVYGEFISLARQAPGVAQLLPVTPLDGPTSVAKAREEIRDDEDDELADVELADTEPSDEDLPDDGEFTSWIYEPNKESILLEVLPKYVKIQIYQRLLDTSASEHAARMTAMDNATRNCDDMAAALTLLYNKTRQAAITRDLMDIVGGSEALNEA